MLKKIIRAMPAVLAAITFAACGGNTGGSPASPNTMTSSASPKVQSAASRRSAPSSAAATAALPTGVSADQQLCWNPASVNGPIYKHGWDEHWMKILGSQVTEPLRGDEQKLIADGAEQGNAPNSDLARTLRDCMQVPIPDRWKAFWRTQGVS